MQIQPVRQIHRDRQADRQQDQYCRYRDGDMGDPHGGNLFLLSSLHREVGARSAASAGRDSAARQMRQIDGQIPEQIEG